MHLFLGSIKFDGLTLQVTNKVTNKGLIIQVTNKVLT